MTKINLRKAAVGLLIAVPMLLVGVSGGAAYAGDTDGGTARAEQASVTPMDAGNNNATVIGVPFCANINVNADCWTWENDTLVPCPIAHFCLYTNSWPAPGGKVFSLYRCREYSLSNWLDQGFVWNHNTGDKPGFLRDRNHVNLPGGVIPAGEVEFFNFFPVWYVKAC